MEGIERRIDRAWPKCKSWITEFNGSPKEAYMLDVERDVLAGAFERLARQSRDLRVARISGEGGNLSQPADLESIESNIGMLEKGEIAGVNVNCVAALEGFDLDVHMIVHADRPQKVDLEIVWWADQVFEEETDHAQRFKTLMRYFIGLQSLFKAAKLYVGPENYEKPDTAPGAWIEV